MKMRKILFTAIFGILLLIGTGGLASAQAEQMRGFFAEAAGQASGPLEVPALRLFPGLPAPLLTAQPAAPAFILAEQFALTPVHADHRNFTTGERWGTFLLNTLVPGLGSFLIMGDTTGALINLALGVGAYTCYILFNTTSGWGWRGGQWNFIEYWGFIIAGVGLHIVQFSYNVFRSATFNRPLPPGLAFLLDNDAFDMALVPGQNGRSQLAFTWTLRY